MTPKEKLQYYKDHLMTVEEAVKLVNSGDLIIDGHGHGRSDIFGPALMARANELKDVRLTTGYNLGQSLHCDPQYEGHFKHVSIFDIAQTRQAHWEGRADFAAGHFSQLERIFASWNPKVLFTQVTPPNEEGYVSMGLSVDFTRAMLDKCPIVIAQVNKNMPWTNGDGVVPVTDITAFVEQDTEIPEIPEATNPSDIDVAIAGHIAELVNDGDTLQIGVGSVPDTVLSMLTNHKHLGIHTELGSTGIMKLMQKGVIDNSMKTLDRGKVVCTLMGGTKEFYKFVDHNDDFVMRRSAYVLNPAVICQQKNMVAMNSAIEIDLLGQVNSEMIGGKEFSGVGGQVDFLRGAMMSEGGKSILCMPSTAARGKKSRIIAQLDAGTVVTASRYDVMYVVTEYGIADLWGKTNDERAKQLIEIAHPDFRAQLEKDFWEKIHKVV
ncbi:MAG: acetyl-CoA hydrolase/transferase C-terminal domain-containing protein [Anaerobutyricum sp.]|nr:acetyl-CoA hydrolase/transferase C-terminal domain-containing protein [Anaerobutyricum sp.]